MQPKPALSELLFGRVITDHMLQAAWDVDRGWRAPSIDPLAPLQLHPAAQVLHYGLECFEGMKVRLAQQVFALLGLLLFEETGQRPCLLSRLLLCSFDSG